MNIQTNILTTTYAPGTLTEQQIGEIWKAKAKAAGNRRGVPASQGVRPGIKRSDRQKATSFGEIESALMRGGPMPAHRIAGVVHLSPNTVKDYLARMAQDGRVRGAFVGRSMHYQVASPLEADNA